VFGSFLDELLEGVFFDGAGGVWVELFAGCVHGAAVAKHEADAPQVTSLTIAEVKSGKNPQLTLNRKKHPKSH